jgi:hypothetical protein
VVSSGVARNGATKVGNSEGEFPPQKFGGIGQEGIGQRKIGGGQEEIWALGWMKEDEGRKKEEGRRRRLVVLLVTKELGNWIAGRGLEWAGTPLTHQITSEENGVGRDEGGAATRVGRDGQRPKNWKLGGRRWKKATWELGGIGLFLPIYSQNSHHHKIHTIFSQIFIGAMRQGNLMFISSIER